MLSSHSDSFHHEFHDRMTAWVQAQQPPHLSTCSITELGFVRALAQAPAYGFTIVQARTLLLRLKKSSGLSISFIHDTHDISHLPARVRTARQITDSHLAELAG